MTIEQIGILLTLLLTIIGWVVTAYYQRKILDHQLESEKERDARMLIIPARIQRLNEMRTWVDSSTKIMTFKIDNLLIKIDAEKSPKPPLSNLEEMFRDWYAESTKYSAFITQMESVYAPKQKDLGTLVSQLHQSMIAFMSLDIINSIDEIKAVNQSLIELVAKLLVGIDELIELCAVRELR